MWLLPDKKEDVRTLPETLITIHELISYLTRLNDNVMVYVRKIYIRNEDGIKIYEMSNGLSYKNANGNWSIFENALTE